MFHNLAGTDNFTPCIGLPIIREDILVRSEGCPVSL